MSSCIAPSTLRQLSVGYVAHPYLTQLLMKATQLTHVTFLESTHRGDTIYVAQLVIRAHKEHQHQQQRTCCGAGARARAGAGAHDTTLDGLSES